MIFTKQKMLKELKKWVFEHTARHMNVSNYKEISNQTSIQFYEGEGFPHWNSKTKTIGISSVLLEDPFYLTIALSEEVPHVIQYSITGGYYGGHKAWDKLKKNKLEFDNFIKIFSFEESIAHTVSERVIGDFFGRQNKRR